MICGTTDQRLLGWFVVALFFLYDLFCRLSVDVVQEALQKDFNCSASTASTAFGASFFYAYGAMQIPHGYMLDRFGPRVTLTLACLSTAVGGVVFAMSSSVGMAAAGRVLAGGGAGAAVQLRHHQGRRRVPA